jgi:ATP-dependent protease ClpP protease subunit
MIDSLAKETKMTKKEISAIFATGHDYFVTAEDAIKYGIADGYLGESKSSKVNL